MQNTCIADCCDSSLLNKNVIVCLQPHVMKEINIIVVAD